MAFTFLLYTSFWIKPNNVYANDLELVGKENGLNVVPLDSKLFDINNLSPGDNITSALKIRNEDNKPFTLFMKTELQGNVVDESNLYKKLVLKVYYKNEKIYDGAMNGFGNPGIELGKFYPETEEKIVATVNLPGPETGNEYQGKGVKVKWIFVAQSSGKTDKDDDDDDDKPKEDENPGDNNPTDDNKPEEEIEIPDSNVPEGKIDVPSNNKPEETTKISDNIVPAGRINIKMPKTGESSHGIYYLTGSILILSGIGFLFKSKKH